MPAVRGGGEDGTERRAAAAQSSSRLPHDAFVALVLASAASGFQRVRWLVAPAVLAVAGRRLPGQAGAQTEVVRG